MPQCSYHLEPEATIKDDTIVIRIEGKPDSELLNTLKKEEARYLTKKIGRKPFDSELSSDRFHLSPQNANDILKEIAATGLLQCNGKNIVCDFYSKNSLTFLVDEDLIIGQVQTRKGTFELSDSPFIGRGSPHCFLDGITLRFLTTDLPWKTFKKTYTLDPPPSLEEVQECVIEDDEDTPTIEYISNASADILPILKLKDHTGAFADLWLEDGSPGNDSSWEKDLLETDFTKRSTEYFCPLDKVHDSLSFLLELGWRIENCEGKRVKLAGSLSLSTEVHGETIIVKGSLPFGDEEADITAIAQAKTPFVTLSESSVGLLPKSSEIQALAREGEIVSEGIKLNTTQAMSFEPVLKTCSLDLFQSPKAVEIGSRFQGTLRPYQQAGVEWLSFLTQNGFHGILADDMGLGKTVQVLAYLSTIDHTAPSLIVMPTSLLYNWKKEAERFYPSLKVAVHHGPEREKCELPAADLVLTSYGTLLRDRDLFKQTTFQCLFLDEAQSIKNRNTQQFQTVCELKADFRCCITGTPIENRTEELFSHFHFLIPDLLNGCAPQDIPRVKRKTKPFILRRVKEQVAQDLPEKIEQNVWIQMQDEQKQIYDQFLASSGKNLIKKVQLDGAGKHRMEIFETLLRLRQICCHPQLVNGNESRSAKLDALLNDMQTIQEEGKKALIFSQFTSMLTLIKRACADMGWNYSYLDGQTKNRADEVERFQEDADTPFFLISLKAGGVGLNLTAADYVLLYDPWWNPAVEQQAIDRAHRIGRKETVIAKRYLCLESIEEKMLQLNMDKRKLSDSLLDETSIDSVLSEDDFLFLLD